MTIGSYFISLWRRFAPATDYLKDNGFVTPGASKISAEVANAFANMKEAANTATQHHYFPSPSHLIEFITPLTPPTTSGTSHAINEIANGSTASPFGTSNPGFPPPSDPPPSLDMEATSAVDPLAKAKPSHLAVDLPNTWLSLGGLFSVGMSIAKILPLIPPLLYAIYKSEERILQNINVNILATPIPKRYSVGFGNKDGEEMSIDFEVVAGRFYQEEIIESNDGFAYTIFQPKSFLSYFPLLSRFEWKRKIHETECNVFIDDPGNVSLQNGPITVYYPLSENEGFNLIYRDPTTSIALTSEFQNLRKHDYHCNAEDSGYSSFNVASTQIIEPLGKDEKERTQISLLPFDDDPDKADEYYLKVTQYNHAT
ncbi:MAG TPA: hypothetical protein VGP47_06760 [Parachlamydiaceae bacterium]|nr:hypothetical protein [Parachlamydiaceae bacterium]